MKAIPRFREAIAFLKLRHQPAHIKYPLIALQIASNPGIYSAEQLNVREEVCHATCKQLDLMLLAGRANGRAHATVLCPYCLSSVCNLCIVAKRSVLPKNCLKKQTGNGLWGKEWSRETLKGQGRDPNRAYT